MKVFENEMTVSSTYKNLLKPRQ